jgi:hypothetical protein
MINQNNHLYLDDDYYGKRINEILSILQKIFQRKTLRKTHAKT